MEYPTIERGVARNMLERFQDGKPAPPDERHTKWVGDGVRLEEETIQAVLDSLEECKSEFPEDRLPQNQGRIFEREATPILHSVLDIERPVAGDPGFWRWVTFFALDGSFRSIVDWRFSANPLSRRTIMASAIFGRVYSLDCGSEATSASMNMPTILTIFPG